ncbi:hypothetical protein E4U59_000951 [Claviceps monticola]|nr:hypothetical protein E4U59_000951 [Claviceps monticola]
MIQAPFGIQFQGLVDDLKELNLHIRVPEAKQFRIDEAKAKSIMCDAPFLEDQGFLDEYDSTSLRQNGAHNLLNQA